MAEMKLISEPWDIGPDGYQRRQLPAGLGRMERAIPRRRCAASGRATRAWSPRWRRASPARPTSSAIAGAGPGPASTSSPRMTASRCRTSSATSRSTTRPTAKTTATATTPTSPGTAVSKVRPTTPKILALRDQQKRNLMATLLLSLGVPMLLAGDEFGHSQQGNNNAYCQDNEISWLDWETIRPEDEALRSFVRHLIRLRRQHRVFSRPRFFRGESVSEAGLKDITWVTPAGVEPTTGGLGQPGRAVARLCAVRRGRRVLHAGRPARHRRELSRHDERAITATSISTCPQ